MADSEVLELIRARFRLKGEEVLRDGKRVRVSETRRYTSVYVGMLNGRRIARDYHRIKFLLGRGWLPKDVDHEDGDTFNNKLSNLRPSSHEQNRWNTRSKGGRALPRGVRARGGKFQAYLVEEGKQRHLGTFASAEAASLAVRRKSKELRGEFYRYRRK